MEKVSRDNSGPGYHKHPAHSVSIVAYQGRTTVRIGGTTLAESSNAMLLTETGYSDVYYLPRQDVRFDKLQVMAGISYCPFKGEARYWCVKDDTDNVAVAWSYDQPYAEVALLTDYVAFYKERVTQTLTDA